MVSNQTPSTSTAFHVGEGIGGAELDRLMRDDCIQLCVLDCRSEGPTVRTASRVRLPNVLFRRLQNGSLALSNVSPRLSEEGIQVIIIPGTGCESATSLALTNALRKEGYQFRVLFDPVDAVISLYPNLRNDDNDDRMCSPRSASDVGCLNLNSLRIEPDVSSKADKRQVFPVQILPHLYLGNFETASNLELLERHGIHHIINVTSNLPNVFGENSSFHYLRISVDDNSSHNLIQFFPEAISFIDTAERAGDACLVHCLAGISRSVTVCLAYLMTTHKWSLEDAYDLVLRRNASIAPNFHFMGQLTDYERHLGLKSATLGTYPSMGPRSPFCAVEAAVGSGLLTPPPTSCSASPQSSVHSAKSFD